MIGFLLNGNHLKGEKMILDYKDVNDLKTLISITSQWIEMELNADEYLNDMPEKNK